MRSNAYCGNLLWQSNLTLQAPGYGTRNEFADAQARLIYGKLPEATVSAAKEKSNG